MARDRLHPRRVVGPVVVLAALAGLAALLGASEPPSWLGWSPRWLSVTVVAGLGVLVAWWAQPWAARRRSDADLEWHAVARLRRHLGRRQRLLRIGRDSGLALTLRVHPAIPLPAQSPGASQAGRLTLLRRWLAGRPPAGGLDRDLPRWVNRDCWQDVCGALGDAARRSGFVLVVGDSSVGKTRLLYEAAHEVLPGWAVLAPDLGDGALINAVAEATFKLPKLLIWLDELQRFLDGPYLSPGSTPVTAGALRRLLDSPGPVVIVGTLWPDHVQELRGTETDMATGERRARYPAAADILDERRHQEITLHTFSLSERDAAAALAEEDPRLAEAVADQSFNVTEVLAGAPSLIRRYEQATPGCHAVLQAAVDARRVGIAVPLTEPLLLAAARGYLTTVHPGDDWFPAALAELTRRDRGTAPLIAVPDAERRRVHGYTVADYLQQYAIRRHRSDRIPEVAWHAFIQHTDDLDDLARIALSAHHRMLHRIAEPAYLRLSGTSHHDARWGARNAAEIMIGQGRVEEGMTLLRRAADAGDLFSQRELAYQLARQDRVGELRSRADAADREAASELIGLLVRKGDHRQAVGPLRDWADSDDWQFAFWARERLAVLHAKLDDVESLRASAMAGDFDACRILVGLLRDRGEPEQAIDVLRGHVDAGEQWAVMSMASLLATLGRGEQAMTVLSSWLARNAVPQAGSDSKGQIFRAGYEAVQATLVRLLLDQDMIDEAVQAIRRTPALMPWGADGRIVRHLAEKDDLDGLRLLADAGKHEASWQLAAVLAERGDLAELRARATAGDYSAMAHLSEIMTGQGDIDQLLTMLRTLAESERVEGGRGWAQKRLADLLAELGDLGELRALADAGSNDAAWQLAQLLAERGDLVTLRARAHAGDTVAGIRFADALVERADLDELRALAETGNDHATGKLTVMLAERGELDQAAAILRASPDLGYMTTAWRHLIDFLIKQDRAEDAIAELTGQVERGRSWAADPLADLLSERGDLTRLRALARVSVRAAAYKVLDALLSMADLDGLRVEVDAGTPGASACLIQLVERITGAAEADRLRSYGLNADGSAVQP